MRLGRAGLLLFGEVYPTIQWSQERFEEWEGGYQEKNCGRNVGQGNKYKELTAGMDLVV